MSREVETTSSSAIAALCGHVIDYAGTFPPASLSLSEAVDGYARYRNSAHASILNRFIVSARDLNAFNQLAAPHAAERPWSLSVVCAGAEDVECARRWRSEVATIASLELRRSTPFPQFKGEVFIEHPLEISRDELEGLGRNNALLKIRLGGESTPRSSALAGVLSLCAELGVSLKATAGLHQAIRSESHGFLNLLLAATLAHQGGDVDEVEALLDETDAARFRFDVNAITWRQHCFGIETIVGARRLVRSFGSCSFDEPLESLDALGLEPR